MDKKALDVRREGHETEEGVFALRRFVEGRSYYDSRRQRWIGSVGRNVHTGRLFAAIDTRFYQDPNWECLLLR